MVCTKNICAQADLRWCFVLTLLAFHRQERVRPATSQLQQTQGSLCFLPFPCCVISRSVKPQKQESKCPGPLTLIRKPLAPNKPLTSFCSSTTPVGFFIVQRYKTATKSPQSPGLLFFQLLAVLGLRCCVWAFSSCGEQGYPLLWSWASRCGGFSSCVSWALGHRLNSCGAWA